ncbi:hypothetical protein EV677_1233 [Herminiimonas fonticola]|uniref:Uncharacterized protein n=1 Tax=Herminiimonas fonticola TaxID=303380 RepID=A0A4R6GI56_9BURK|nr:hypothetical protein Hfont_1201 [Herminiimonas fonticola]TDN94679.1 hypothetical protein EV677_1233 [Herminiimonas fonticola]
MLKYALGILSSHLEFSFKFRSLHVATIEHTYANKYSRLPLHKYAIKFLVCYNNYVAQP